MSDSLKHECSISALYSLPSKQYTLNDNIFNVVELMPQMLLEQQNRGQLAAGITSYSPERVQLLKTYKDIGTVQEVFQMSNSSKFRSILEDNSGIAVIGHTRYATSGLEDSRFAQPFERNHGKPREWFSFAFNGNLTNIEELQNEYQNKRGYHLSLNNDTEIIMYILCDLLSDNRTMSFNDIMHNLSNLIDGAYTMVFLDALGRMFVSRDPLGIRPLNWAMQDGLFGAASESSALVNLGFKECRSLVPGEMVIIENGTVSLERYTDSDKRARCFFEWIYFSNVSSEIDGISVYSSREILGKKLADIEDQIIDDNCIVIPVPDTAKTTADSYAYYMHMRCVEGIIRNRYIGRTFIQSEISRKWSVKNKYTPLSSVLKDKKVFLVEDSIVRSTTLKSLARKLKIDGGAKEIHIRVACPPIISPCFYGIDLPTYNELFAPQYLDKGYNGFLSKEIERKMCEDLDADSLHYVCIDDIVVSLQTKLDTLCTGCITNSYPTAFGNAKACILNVKKDDKYL